MATQPSADTSPADSGDDHADAGSGTGGAGDATVTSLGRIAVLGLGRIGTALASAVLASDQLEVEGLVGTDADPKRASAVAQELGIATGSDNAAAVVGAQIVVLAVKPNIVADLLDEVATSLDDDTLVVSVAAGITTAAIESHLAGQSPVVRIMPNTPLLVGEAMSVLSAGTNAGPEHLERVAAMVAAAGQVRIIDESLFDAVTAVSGSGPAWVFALAEAMIAGAEDQGLAHDDAVALVNQTIKGAGVLLATSELGATGLREMVSSPGGTTLAGLAVLDGAGMDTIVRSAIAAATARGRELGA